MLSDSPISLLQRGYKFGHATRYTVELGKWDSPASLGCGVATPNPIQLFPKGFHSMKTGIPTLAALATCLSFPVSLWAEDVSAGKDFASRSPFALTEYQPDEKAREPSDKNRTMPQTRKPDFTGEWRLFLPAGFERQVTITAKEPDLYQIKSNAPVFNAIYRMEGGQLAWVGRAIPDGASIESLIKKADGYKWKVQSPYLMTLVYDHQRNSANYLGAILFRPNANSKPKEARSTAGKQRNKFAAENPQAISE